MPSEMPVVFITGAAGHLGKAVAALFAERGAHLALVGRNTDKLRRAFPTADGQQQLLLAADLTKQDAVDQAVAQTIEHFGRIDVLCNIAGGFHMGESVHETPDTTWDFMFALNVRTLTHAAHAVVPHMLRAGHGKIVNIGAFSAPRGAAHMGAYKASKSAVIRLTETMAAELREHGINVNCVLPTIIDTLENRAAMPNADPARWVAPRALAEVIAFLASDAARAIHGAALPVAGLS
jgi:NAD(P)-dependent dehydrogenase (short-subunit alcohol dehydrogenase family)